MAKLYEYDNGEGYYIKASFSRNGMVYHVTYQIKSEALDIFRKNSLGHGDTIPKPLLQQLLSDKLIFTGASGVDGQLTETGTQNGGVDPFNRLSQAAKRWVILRIVSHPKVKASVEVHDDSFAEVNIEKSGIPKHYEEMLIKVAAVCDGTSFLDELNASYDGFRLKYLGLKQ